jgi:phage terminase Nu1 subunit (DNA packaging protein)
MNDDFPTPLRWKPQNIANEFGLSKATVFRRLKEAGLTGKERDGYSTEQVTEALFSDYAHERTRLVRLQAEQQELRLAQMRGELIDKTELILALTGIFLTVKGIIQSSELDRRSQNDIFDAISDKSMRDGIVQAVLKSKQKVGLRGVREAGDNE